ncbi:MAG TPA: adenylate/guanylate cyclase domain-containing protein [Anaerolineales bacterium]|nr:adenylate/guanylate cyclase domain-containing protein [Anaerolineales bacterium]
MPNPALANVLASYVPRLIQHRVIADPSPIETPASDDFHAAVLFADISGFTLLTERLAEKGPTGVESLARILNEYFGQLIDIIHEYGGDVVKFAGDAVIAVWNIASDDGTAGSPTRADQWQWTMRAAECALRVREKLTNYKAEDASLYLKLAISMGNITSSHVGGVFNRWEFLLTGNPLVEVGIANNLAQASEILVAPSAWKLIRNDSIGEPIEFELKETIAQGGRLEGLNKPSSIFNTPEKPAIPSGVENSLRPYIPGAIINRLTAGQTAWIAELRRVTVLFINLPNLDQSTKLEVAQEIARLLQRSVYRYEGSINKINVDDKGITLVAALGLPPFSHEDDPARGVQAALMIRRELNALGVRSFIGVATGRIFCGSVGNEERREYTTIGNAVNMSARLMGAAGLQDEIIGEHKIPILCDRATYDSAKDAIEFQTIKPQSIKGRAEPVEAFHPLDVKRSIIRSKAELIGRQDEKILLGNALQELSRGAPYQTIVFQGEAGIGKSRLFEDLIRQAETLRVHMFRGEGDAIEKNSPYHAWRPIFHRILGVEEITLQQEFSDDDRSLIHAKVAEALTRIDPDLARYAPLLDVLLPVPISDNELTSAMAGEIRASNTRELLTRLLNQAASDAPLLIVMEDLHWFDSASWALLVDAQQKVRPLLLTLNTRPLSEPLPETFRQIVAAPGARLIRLEAMPLDDVEALVCQRLGVRSIPPAIGSLIREKSEGHPFFAEELAYALRETGLLVIREHEATINESFTDFAELTLPDTLQAAITNRIDSLDPSQQLALKVASVIGRIFAFRALQAVYPIDSDKPALREYMESLTRLSLTLVESETPDLAYIFKHAVTREVAYNLMLFSQRRQLHQSVAEWIETSNEGNLDSYYPLLAYHWSQAAETPETSRNDRIIEKAVEFLDKAGVQAVENNANREAIQFFKDALTLDSRLPKPAGVEEARDRKVKRARWYGQIGLAYYGLGLLPDCEKNIREAFRTLGKPLPKSPWQFALGLIVSVIRQAFHWFVPSRIGSARGRERDASLELARLYELIGRMYFYANETLPIMYSILQFLNSAEKVGASPELANAYSGMAVLSGFARLHPLAERYVERALTVAKEVNQPSNLITVGVVTSVYRVSVGQWAEIRKQVTESKVLCEELGDSRQWGDCTVLLAESAYLSGDLDFGLNLQKTLLDDARKRNSPLHIEWGLAGVAANSVRLGNEAEAIPMLEEALQILEKIPNRASSINTNGELALALLKTGDTRKAKLHAAEALRLARGSSPTNYAMLIGFSTAAEVYFTLWDEAVRARDGRFDAADLRASAEEALTLLHSYKNVFPIGQAYFGYFKGWHESLIAKPTAAMRSWSKALEAAEKFGLRYEEGIVRVKLAQHLESNPTARAEHLARASRLFEAMGMARELEDVRKLMG